MFIPATTRPTPNAPALANLEFVPNPHPKLRALIQALVRNEMGELPIWKRTAGRRKAVVPPKNKPKRTKSNIAMPGCLLVLTTLVLATFAGRISAQQQSTSEVPAGLLLLVRAWEPKTGQLIGWMPMHGVALTLQHLTKDEGTPTFGLNEAVVVDFPYRPRNAVKYGQLRIVHETASFQGREWMPVEQSPNLLHIHNFTFYVKFIDFVESKWRNPTVVDPVKHMLRK